MTLDNKIIISRDVIFDDTTTDYSKHENEDMDELLDASFFQTNTMPNSNPEVIIEQTTPLQQLVIPPQQQSTTSHGSQT